MKLTKDNYYLFAAGIGTAGLGVAVYNMYRTRKYRTTMLGLQNQNHRRAIGEYPSGENYGDDDGMGYLTDSFEMGAPENDLDNAYFDADSAASQVTSFSEGYVDRGAAKIENVLQSEAFQETLKNMGISISPETLNKKMIKNLLTAYGLFSVFMLLRNNFLKVGVVALAVYIATQNKDRVMTAFDSALSEVSTLT